MELRKSRHMTQVQLAKLLEITQGTLSRLESQEAVPMLDTLNNYIRAMGGELVIGARFPDAQYLIDIGEKARGLAKSKRSHAKIKAA